MRAARWVVCVALVIVTLGSLALISGNGPASAADDAATAHLRACVNERDSLSVLFLVDTSGSLARSDGGGPGTDVGNRRVDGLKAALYGLGQLSESEIDGRKPRVDVLLAGFASEYQPATGWTSVNTASVPGLVRVADGFAAKNNGLDTDYGTALIGARRDLQGRAVAATASGGRPPCQVIVWFTDGKFDIGDRISGRRANLPQHTDYAPDLNLGSSGAGAHAVQRGRDFLCTAGGYADQLRADGIQTFTVALSSGLAPADSGFLQALTTGASPSARCGNVQAGTNGRYIPVEQIQDLALELATLFEGGTDPINTPASFEIIPAISGFRLHVATGGAGRGIKLTAPSGEPLTITLGQPQARQLSGASIKDRWITPDLATIDGDVKSIEDATGVWNVDVVAANGTVAPGARITIQLIGALQPKLMSPKRVTVAEPAALDVQLVDAKGTPLTTGAIVEGATLTGSAKDPVTGATMPITFTGSAGRFSGELTLPDTYTATEVTITMSAAANTPAGAELASTTSVVTLPVQLPPIFPTLHPSRLDLPSIGQDSDSTKGKLTFIGSEVADGCAWISGVDLKGGGDDIGSDVVSASPSAKSRSDCIKIPRHEKVPVALTFGRAGDAHGLYSGSVTITMTSSRDDSPRQITVPVGYPVAATRNTALDVAVFTIILLLGILAPFLFLALLNWYAARFQKLSELRVYHASIRWDRTGTPVTTVPKEFDTVTEPTERVRQYEGADLTLRTVAIGNPFKRLFAGPIGVVRATKEGHYVIGGSVPGPFHPHRGDGVETPLSLNACWFLVTRPIGAAPTTEQMPWDDDDAPAASPSAAVIAGELYVYLRDGTVTDQIRPMSERVANQLPGAYDALVERVTAEQEAAPKSKAKPSAPDSSSTAGADLKALLDED